METQEIKCKKFILQFISDFEGDYLLDGDLVDNPNNLLLINYIRAKELLKEIKE